MSDRIIAAGRIVGGTMFAAVERDGIVSIFTSKVAKNVNRVDAIPQLERVGEGRRTNVRF